MFAQISEETETEGFTVYQFVSSSSASTHKSMCITAHILICSITTIPTYSVSCFDIPGE
jgi:hypothetical protein